jgi:hypothetical protein
MGSNHVPQKTHFASMAFVSAVDITTSSDSTITPDTTYFYSNKKIQATMHKVDGSIAMLNTVPHEFEFTIKTDLLNTNSLESMGWGGVIITNSKAFKLKGIQGSLTSLFNADFEIQTIFDCNYTGKMPNDLTVAFLKYQPDSVKTPPDTLFYYNLATKGMQSTARYLVGCK